MNISHKKLELSFDLPNLRQRGVEEFFAILRRIKGGGIDAHKYGEEITDFVKSLPKLDGERFGLVLREFIANLQAEQKRSAQLSIPENRGAIVRAAASCGWLKDVTEETVDDMLPAAVHWLSREIDNWIADSQDVPGE